MAKDPAVLFYTSDFLTGTSFFTMEQKGQYITLLCQQHQLWSIPENHMISVCGSLDSPVIKKFIKGDDGNYYNNRMRIETERRLSYCNSRSNNKSGRPKKEIIRESYDNSMIIHMETETETETEDINNNIFLSFWESYPKKVGKGAALKAWSKIKEPSHTLEKIKKALEWQINSDQWKKDNGQYIPNPATYLNQTRWEDEKGENKNGKLKAERFDDKQYIGTDPDSISWGK